MSHLRQDEGIRASQRARDGGVVSATSITQSVINILEQHRHADQVDRPSGGAACTTSPAWSGMRCRCSAATVRTWRGIIDGASLLVGGDQGRDPRLFNIYPQGNFIEASADTLYFQLGRASMRRCRSRHHHCHQSRGCHQMRAGVVRFDHPAQHLGRVADRRDVVSARLVACRRAQAIVEGDAYFSMLRQAWGTGLRRVFGELGNPDWMS